MRAHAKFIKVGLSVDNGAMRSEELHDCCFEGRGVRGEDFGASGCVAEVGDDVVFDCYRSTLEFTCSM